MPNSTRRRVGHRAASPANMHENTRSRTATASGGTPSLAREEADDEAASNFNFAPCGSKAEIRPIYAAAAPARNDRTLSNAEKQQAQL